MVIGYTNISSIESKIVSHEHEIQLMVVDGTNTHCIDSFVLIEMRMVTTPLAMASYFLFAISCNTSHNTLNVGEGELS
jgi:hypothetical protein